MGHLPSLTIIHELSWVIYHPNDAPEIMAMLSLELSWVIYQGASLGVLIQCDHRCLRLLLSKHHPQESAPSTSSPKVWHYEALPYGKVSSKLKKSNFLIGKQGKQATTGGFTTQPEVNDLPETCQQHPIVPSQV